MRSRAVNLPRSMLPVDMLLTASEQVLAVNVVQFGDGRFHSLSHKFLDCYYVIS